MSSIKAALEQADEPDKSIGKLLIEFYEHMKRLEKDPEGHGPGKQAVLIVMTIADMKKISQHINQ